jgi:hypothetical protein
MKIVSSRIANSKLVKQEVNGTVILPPLVFPGLVIRKYNLLQSTVLPAGLSAQIFAKFKIPKDEESFITCVCIKNAFNAHLKCTTIV